MATNLTPPPAEDAVPPGGSAHAENTFPAQIQDEEKYWTEIPSEGGERQQFSAPRDWFAEYDAATKPERVTEANAPSWVLRMCAKKNLPLEGMASRDWHPARFEGRKNTALIIPCVVNGQFVGIQKWYDPEHAPPNNRKNRWTQKDPDQAFYNIGMIHDPDIDAPIYMLESPTDALSGDHCRDRRVREGHPEGAPDRHMLRSHEHDSSRSDAQRRVPRPPAGDHRPVRR